MPPYVVFHDTTLREMALDRPQTMAELATISGVGESRVEALWRGVFGGAEGGGARLSPRGLARAVATAPSGSSGQ